MSGVVRAADAPRKITPGTVRRIWAFARPHRGGITAFLVLTVASAVIGVVTPLLAGKVVDAIVHGGEGEPGAAQIAAGVVIGLAGGIAALAVSDAALGLVSRWFSARVGEQLIVDLRCAVYEHVQRMPIAFFTRTRTGALVSRLNNDVIGAQSAITSTLANLVSNAIALVLALVVMLGLAWQVTLCALVLLPVFVIPARRMGHRIADLRRESANLNASMSAQMTERFSAPGATLVTLFGRPTEEAAEFRTRAVRVRDIGVRTAMVSRVFVTALSLVSALAQALVYGLGGWLAGTGRIEAGALVSPPPPLPPPLNPPTPPAHAPPRPLNPPGSLERGVLGGPPPTQVTPTPPPPTVPDGPLGVALRDVRFGYPGAHQVSLASLEEVAVLDDRAGREVLHGVDLDVAPGTMLALVGSSGAGKSTIASLVPRLYDVDSGSVTVGGVDVRDLTFASLRGAVGVVTQDGHLFHDTVAANLRSARPDSSDDGLGSSLRRARLDDMVASLPDGLDTVVGERGYRLSGGERQRLTIARLLLARPRVVILDEATAHLDSESEAAVQEALAEALAGRTAVVIAHRLSTVRAADTIAVVEAGRVVERGTHDALLAADGRYAVLYRTQFATAPVGLVDDGEVCGIDGCTVPHAGPHRVDGLVD